MSRTLRPQHRAIRRLAVRGQHDFDRQVEQRTDPSEGWFGPGATPASAEVTYWIGRWYWGKGIATDASRRSWPLIGRGRSTPASRLTTSRPAASSRSVASA